MFYVHESGICIVAGLIIGFFIERIVGDLPKFESRLFFNFMLPLLVLGAGYNMKRRRFFRNIGTILMLGIWGTLITFIIIGVMTYYWSEAGLITRDGKTIYITLHEALLIGATLSATDVVCSLALVKEEKTPRLHSVLFGESVSNDAIAILLLVSLENVDIKSISAISVFEFIGEFIYNCISSTLLGIFFGGISAYVTKIFRSLKEWPSRQTALLLYIAWIGYIIAGLCDISGVICILVCSIVSGHYAMYNLSPSARIVSHNCFHFIGDASEALVFGYLGLTAYSYDLFSVPLPFLMAMLFSVLMARFAGTFLLNYLVSWLTCGKFNLGMKNLAVIWIGGIVRGGISFALILNISGDNSIIIQITVLAFVILTILLFGTILPLWVLLIDAKEASVSIVVHDGHGPAAIIENETDRSWLHRKWKWLDDNYIKKLLICEEFLDQQRKHVSELENRIWHFRKKKD